MSLVVLQNVAPPAPTFFTGGNLNNPRTTFETETSSYAIADMMTFADGKFMLTLGARDQTLKNDNFDYNTGARLSGFDESEVTPVGGVVFRPTDSLSVFANYIEGLVAGDTAPFTGPAPRVALRDLMWWATSSGCAPTYLSTIGRHQLESSGWAMIRSTMSSSLRTSGR